MESVGTQAFIAQVSIETLNVGILHLRGAMRFWIGPTWRTILPTSANYYVGTKWVCGLR